MAKTHSPLDRIRDARALRRWRRQANTAESTPLAQLRPQLEAARQLRAALDDHIHVSENRLALPRIGSDAFFRPDDADWSWRPEINRGPLPKPGISGVQTRTKLGEELTLFHDCPLRELTLRQVRNRREEDLAPFGLRLEVFKFEGSFLSIVLDLPKEAAEGLKKRHLIRFDTLVQTESPIEIFARLNVQHGPNCEQIVRELPQGSGDSTVEFDLGYTEFSEKRSERLWLDLIFDNPEMNQITVRDMTFSRCPRAEM
ncbi:MAG: hypothetical protein CSA72_06955 [Rhodobacterales bacterium]|nr:MAG: hypothetical protein CSA72_06955 [Rhodobacterales bacterium]